MPEMTENQTPGHTPRKKKNKESHNAVERQRKEKINAGINRIGDLLPCSQALKQSKNMILDQAHRYIIDLQKQNDAMLLERGDRIQAEEIRRLRRQLEELRKESGHYIDLLKAHNINFLDDPTIHWKGKLRCAKVAKVTPTHQLPKGIILYSNGNVICPAGKEASPAADLGKRPAEAVIVQSSGDITARIRVNGAVQHVSTPSSAPPLLTPTVSTPGIRLVEQCVAEAPSTPKLPPSVSYITLQGLCPPPVLSTTLPQLATSTQSLTVSASLASPIPSLTALPQVLTTQNAAFGTLSYTTIPSSSTFLRASAAGSTQTTWTTLQLAGNTVQPVCKSLLAPETSTTGPQGIQHLSVGPVVTEPSVQPVHIQVRPQAPITAHIQAQPSIQRTPQLRPAILAQTQPLLVPQPQCAVLPQPAVRPQSAVLAHSTVASQPPAAVLQQAAVLPHPQTAIITQPQPALVPQAQPPTVLPLLQTMQVLQVNPAGTTAVAGVTTPQNTNNPSVVILQQANPCSAQSVVREDLSNQNPCQHIVIIQASNQHPPAPPQNASVGIVTAAATVVPNQSVVTSSATSTTGQQIFGGKQLVHILPRPIPQIQPSPAPQASPAPLTPHTITVNGQVFALQPMQTSDKPGSQGGQGSLQLIQPSSMDEPTTNVALHTLGALSSLNQSISQGMPQFSSTQSTTQLATPSYSIVPSGQPPSSVTVSPAPRSSPATQIQIPSGTPPRPGLAVTTGESLLRPPGTALVSRARKAPPKRSTLVRKKVQTQGQGGGNVSANPVNKYRDQQKQVDSVAQGTPSLSAAVNIQPHPSPATTSVNTPTVSTDDVAVPPNRLVGGSFSSPQATPTANISVNNVAPSEAAASTAGPTHSGSLVTSVIPYSSAVSVGATQTLLTIASSVSLATITPVSSADKPPEISIDGPHHLRPIVAQNRQSASISTVPTSAATNGNSRQSRSMVTRVCSPVTNSSCVITTAVCGHSVCTAGAVESRPVSVQSQLTSSQAQKQPASSQKTLPSSQPKPVASPLPAPIPTPGSSAPASSLHSVSVPMTMSSEYRKRVTYNRPSTQLVTTRSPTTPHLTELKVSAFPSTVKDAKPEGHPGTAVEIARMDAAASRKDSAGTQNIYMLDHEPLEQALPLSRESDSPISGAAGIGRGFSVASMLPTGHSASASSGHSVGVSSGHSVCISSGHNVGVSSGHSVSVSSGHSVGVSSGHSVSVSSGHSIGVSTGHSVGVSTGHSVCISTGHNVCASSGTLGTFTFTTEQADILAMLEQESPGRRVAGCTLDNPDSTPIPMWDPNLHPSKPLHAANSKERGAGQQTKLVKQMETPVARTTSHGSAKGPVGEVARTGPSAARHPQNIYSQSQTQSGTVGTLSVNNLIRPSSRQQQVYTGSPILVGQQGPNSSPAGNSAHASQPPTPGLPPCSGSVQLNEYTPLKSALMRAQVGVGEPRLIKDATKRAAQDDVMLSSNVKRQKPCPSTSALGRVEAKPPEHSQMMAPQPPTSSSANMTRINPDAVGTLFSGNTFMNTVLRPAESHCTPQHEHSQPGVLHLPQGQPQHGAPQPGQHLSGNPYLKQQEHQRHHPYQLQHHLTQSDPTQLHSLHQRTLQQEQHGHKKRALVRGGQGGAPVSLQQKQHHLEKSGVQQQQTHQQQQQHQQPHQQQAQHPQQQQPQQQQHQQQTHQSQQQHQQQVQHQQSHQHPQQTQQHQQQSQSHQQQQHPQQQQLQQQSSHSRHQHLQQQIQQQHFGSRHQDKSCEAQPGPAGPRAHHSSHLTQQDHLKSGQDHSSMQRLMSSRNLEQQLTSQPSNPASRPPDLGCAPSRQERHRVSSYSAEALIGKSSSSGEQQQRMGLHLQATRVATQDQPDLRGYLDISRVKANISHNPQNRLPLEHPGSADVQRVSECSPFKTLSGAGGGHQLGGFEVQVSRGGDMTPKSGPSPQRGPQGQQGGFRMGPGPSGDGRPRGGYIGPHPGTQGGQIGASELPRDQEGCPQSFMQSLLEQSSHQRAVQCCPPVSMEYNCVPGSSTADMQAKASSPSVASTQKAPAMRLGEGNKGHLLQGSGNMGAHPGVRTGLPHSLTPHSSSEPCRTAAPPRPPTTVSQRSRHIAQEAQSGKLRPGERLRSGNLRPGNPFEPDVHLLGRPQSGGEARRSSIVRFMADSTQVAGDNSLVPDQHLAQNFGFPFIPEGGMNPPPPINANSTFIPPASQPNSSRSSALLPGESQNTLPSFYPSYPPAAHPSLASDNPLHYFSNQMFTSPSADKGSSAPLNNRFGSILSPPRPVGFAQPSFPLLSDIPPMPISNSSGITPHLSNFSLTSLFPEIATAMPPDGSAMPMSPLLSLSNTSSADAGKQPNRPAHNISHILGHDGSSAV